MKKDIFLVDADDTLLDFHASSSLAVKAAFVKSGVAWEERFAVEFKRINDKLWAALERKELTRRELLERRFPLYLSEVGVSADSEQFNINYLTYLAENPLYVAGAEAFLRALNKRGRVFIVTNGTERIQKSRFTLCGLWKYAEAVFISESIGANKPEKAYTDYVLSHIQGFDKEHAVWIGDSLSADIRAAKEAGITSIWFNPWEKIAKNIIPDYSAGSFEGILTILQRINADK